MPKYPNISVKLIGHDGNAFSILGRMSRHLRQGGVPTDEIVAFQTEAMSGDYNNLLRTCMKWVTVR